MKKTEEEKLLKVLDKAKWCSRTDNIGKTIYIYSDTVSLKFGNYSKEVKNLTKKYNYSIQLEIK